MLNASAHFHLLIIPDQVLDHVLGPALATLYAVAAVNLACPITGPPCPALAPELTAILVMAILNPTC